MLEDDLIVTCLPLSACPSVREIWLHADHHPWKMSGPVPQKGDVDCLVDPFGYFGKISCGILWIFWQNVFLGFEHAVALTFWLRNSLGATAGCTFWTFIPPDGSAPATLASNTLEKHGFSTFSCTWIFFLLSLYIGFSDSSQECGCICPKSEVWLLNFLHFPSKSFE